MASDRELLALTFMLVWELLPDNQDFGIEDKLTEVGLIDVVSYDPQKHGNAGALRVAEKANEGAALSPGDAILYPTAEGLALLDECERLFPRYRVEG